MNSERTLDITTEHVESAITHYLQSMRLIDQDELITAFVPVGVGTVRISLKKEVLN